MSKAREDLWPESDLEMVGACPFCGSRDRSLAYPDARDLVFRCAPGSWAYWDCRACQSLYLDPRPTAASLGRAYRDYYTHSGVSALSRLKSRLKHECWWQWYRIPLSPRLGLPRWGAWPLRVIQPFTEHPFEMARLSRLTPGRLLDVGCGSGKALAEALQLGWQVLGIEPDPRAGEVARGRGAEVVNSGFEALRGYGPEFDAVLCSHVIEHVHHPADLLAMLASVLRPGGVLLLSCPNSRSVVRQEHGSSWRGLEAPRHLAIPSASYLFYRLAQAGFSVEPHVPRMRRTCPETLQIRARAPRMPLWALLWGTVLQHLPVDLDPLRADYVEVAAVKDGVACSRPGALPPAASAGDAAAGTEHAEPAASRDTALSADLRRHAVIYGLGRLVPAVCALGTIALLTRALGRAEYGRFALASSAALLAAGFASAWLAQGVLRFHSRLDAGPLAADYAAFLRRGRWLCIGGAALAAGSAVAWAGAGGPLISGAAALAAVEASASLTVALEQARVRPRAAVALDGARSAAALAGMAAAAHALGASAAMALWAGALGQGVALLALWRAQGGEPMRLRQAGKRALAAPGRARARRTMRNVVLRYGMTTAAFSLMASALNVADRFLIAHWKGVAEAGSYSAAYDVVYRAVGLFLFPVAVGAYPLLARTWNSRDQGAVQRALRSAMSLELAIGLPLLAALGLGHGLVARYALGRPLDRSLELVLTVGLAALLWQLAQIAHKRAELSGRLWILITGAALALGVNLAANAALVPHCPTVVAGYTSALASLTYLGWVLSRR